ncbi:hypothetical protein I553_4805 [Mycobacterium xenopi 4042]|uniref:Uncharacterized protein n=1 Tax=Mycobacterium xenopi 4042 TaxID=1299334 RepID=X8AHP6_MYCXE|nr:hypothetical protein I553_4805 [Mycobacterium xenopi 4042]
MDGNMERRREGLHPRKLSDETLFADLDQGLAAVSPRRR